MSAEAGADTIVVIQARMGSTRLPGKTLMDVAGMPMLEILLRRLQGLDSVPVIVATSSKGQDDAIETFLESFDDNNVELLRGSEQDVLSRFTQAIEQFDPATVVRLTADNPAVDARSVKKALTAFGQRSDDVDMVSNHGPSRNDPYGLSVEVINASSLSAIAASSPSAHEREHVTAALYAADKCSYYSILGGDHASLRWTVDTQEDLCAARERFRACGWSASIEELIAFDEAI